MKLVTIQHKKVLLDILLAGKIYKNDFKYMLSHSFIDEKREKEERDKILAYQVLMQYYDYKFPPIFCCLVDKHVNFKNTKKSRSNILLELDVPDEYVKLHLIFRWEIIQNKISLEKWDEAEYIHQKPFFHDENLDCGLTVQAVIPYIRPEWLIGAYTIPKNFDKFFKYDNYLNRFDYYNEHIYLK